MAEYYDSMCNRYASMAEDFYLQSKALEEFEGLKEYPLPEAAELYVKHLAVVEQRTRLVIAAIVFQALAIEAYVNLFGVYELGEDRFFKEFEPPRNNRPQGFRPLNTIDKLKMICKEELGQPFPAEHIEKIRQLFTTRDRLVHSKSKPRSIRKQKFDYLKPEKNYEDLFALAEELSFFYDGIEEHMELYRILQDDIMVIRGAEKELTVEISDRWLSDIGRAVEETCASAYNDHNSE